MEEGFRKRLESALKLELSYPERYSQEGGRPAAVLILFAAYQARPTEPVVLLTRRTDSVATHKGQMAFPGGMSESHELGSIEGMVATALRETDEEVGISPEKIEVLGTLPALTIVSGFEVTPVVGVLRAAIEDVPLMLNSGEIAEVVWAPMLTLTEPSIYSTESRRIGEIDYLTHIYQVQGNRVWGATASMIKNLLDRLHSLS